MSDFIGAFAVFVTHLQWQIDGAEAWLRSAYLRMGAALEFRLAQRPRRAAGSVD
jgi:hypothetical protein